MASIDIKSEITGTVWKIEVKEGQSVADGDTLMIMESMKMEIPVISSEDGTVSEICVTEEQAVNEGQLLAKIQV